MMNYTIVIGGTISMMAEGLSIYSFITRPAGANPAIVWLTGIGAILAGAGVVLSGIKLANIHNTQGCH